VLKPSWGMINLFILRQGSKFYFDKNYGV